jgi:hypothetical protein
MTPDRVRFSFRLGRRLQRDGSSERSARPRGPRLAYRRAAGRVRRPLTRVFWWGRRIVERPPEELVNRRLVLRTLRFACATSENARCRRTRNALTLLAFPIPAPSLCSLPQSRQCRPVRPQGPERPAVRVRELTPDHRCRRRDGGERAACQVSHRPAGGLRIGHVGHLEVAKQYGAPRGGRWSRSRSW